MEAIRHMIGPVFGQDTEIGTRFVLVRVISWIAFLPKQERTIQ